MLSIHLSARTTLAVRLEIARSSEPAGVLAQRFGVSTETIRKWCKRRAVDCQEHSSRPHKLPWNATEEEQAIVCAPRLSHRLFVSLVRIRRVDASTSRRQIDRSSPDRNQLSRTHVGQRLFAMYDELVLDEASG